MGVAPVAGVPVLRASAMHAAPARFMQPGTRRWRMLASAPRSVVASAAIYLDEQKIVFSDVSYRLLETSHPPTYYLRGVRLGTLRPCSASQWKGRANSRSTSAPATRSARRGLVLPGAGGRRSAGAAHRRDDRRRNHAVNNAGTFDAKPFLEVTEAAARRLPGRQPQGNVPDAARHPGLRGRGQRGIVNIGTVLIDHADRRRAGLRATCQQGRDRRHSRPRASPPSLRPTASGSCVAPGMSSAHPARDAVSVALGDVALLNRVGEVTRLQRP